LKSNNPQLIYGLHPISEAINSGREINKVYIKKGMKSDQFVALFQKIREYGIPYQYVPVEKLNRMIRGNHQGMIAQLSLIEYKNLEEIVQKVFENGRDPFIVLLDRITDVRNFGAIARTAECAGVDAIVIQEKGSVPVSPDSIKTSSGALNRIAVCRTKDLKLTLQLLKDSGIKVVAASEKATEICFNADLTGPVAILMGSEGSGIFEALIKIANSYVKIPMSGHIESLNVSVAFGIIAFEVIRQRRSAF
jgi:23S rRNA (guanosine2251-2'-O)-methyltransferase